MSTFSFKTAILDSFPKSDLSKGLWGGVVNDFYKSHPETFRYPTSIKALLKTTQWPQNYTRLEDYPNLSTLQWSHEAQGLTNDSNHWFITQKDRVWKFPVGHDLDEAPGKGVASSAIPQLLLDEELNHYGDLDFFQGHLYIPAAIYPWKHIPEEEDRPPGRIALYNAQSLSFIAASETLTTQGYSVGWCAVNPLNGLLYSSHSAIEAQYQSNFLYVYERTLTTDAKGKVNGLNLTLLGNFKLWDENNSKFKISGIQGGVFSKQGHLYLVNHDSDLEKAGIYGFDMITGRKILYKKIEYSASKPTSEELEGITIWDLDSGASPGIGGQIHVILLDNEFTSDVVEIWGDDVSILHFRVSSGDKNKI